MSEKPTIEEHAKNMEDAWRSAEEQNIIFSRKIEALKGAVRSAVQEVNQKDEQIAFLTKRIQQMRDISLVFSSDEKIKELAKKDEVIERLREVLGHVRKMQTLGYIVLGEEATGMIEQALGQADGGRDE